LEISEPLAWINSARISSVPGVLYVFSVSLAILASKKEVQVLMAQLYVFLSA
jgi:hypothetical protein